MLKKKSTLKLDVREKRYDPKARMDMGRLKKQYPTIDQSILVDLELTREGCVIGNQLTKEIVDNVFHELRAKQLDIYKESFGGNTSIETCMMALNEHLTDADGRVTRNDIIEYQEDDQIEPVSKLHFILLTDALTIL